MTNQNSKLIIFGISILLVLVVAGFLVSKKRQDTDVPAVSQQISENFVKGQIAPDVTFTDFNGNIHNLSDFRGKAVVLDFWAAWCPFCIEEMPELQKAQERYKDKLVIIGIHRTETERKDIGFEFAKARGVSYLLVTDSDGSLYRASGGIGMPVAVFINGEGRVVEIKSGPKTAGEIGGKIQNLVTHLSGED